jgi:branched-subunit amino acid transport protein
VSGVWVAVLVVGAASLAFRLLPLLAVERIGMSERTASVLRHAGAGAVASLVVVAVVGRGGQPDPAVLAAIVAGGVASWRERSMISVVVVGGCVYVLAAALTALL